MDKNNLRKICEESQGSATSDSQHEDSFPLCNSPLILGMGFVFPCQVYQYYYSIPNPLTC